MFAKDTEIKSMMKKEKGMENHLSKEIENFFKD